MLDVSCIIINYNTSKYTYEAVVSLLDMHNNTIKFEIIIVDNASKEEDYIVLKSSLNNLNKSNLQLIT